jgi:O-Antigen ligase
MSFRKKLSSLSPTKSSLLGFFQPAPAWTAIMALVLFTTLSIFAGGSTILNIAFPVLSLGVGAFLYFRYPILYIGFTWWMWFLTAFIRRIVDYRSSYIEPSPLLLAPYLVSAVTLVTVFQHLPKAYRQGGLPFILAIAGVFYGFLIGLIYMPPFVVVRSFLDWLSPLTFGFHLLVNWRNFPSYYQNIQRTFFWGTLVMGVYGIYQYIVAPEWDRLWLINSGMISSDGSPVPFGMRVWSTMHSGEPFAAIMCAGLLLQLSNKFGVLNLSASVAGYIAFFLSLVRSAWIGWFAGLITLGISLKAKNQIRLVVIVMVLGIIVVPLATTGIFSETITSRFNSFSNLEQDNSTQVRKEIYNRVIGSALTNFIGDGVGRGSLDSAFLSILTTLGWLGTICYVGGMLLLIFRLFQSSEGSSDLFLGTARAIVMSCLVRFPVNGSPIGGVGGFLLWGFLGLGIASRKYYLYQRTMILSQSLPQNSPK